MFNFPRGKCSVFFDLKKRIVYNIMDNNTMAITVSMGALGATLAYFGYNNYIAKTDKVGGGAINNPDQLASRSDVPSPRNKIESVYDSTTACLQSGGKTTQATPVVESAKQEVAKEVEKGWGQFWQGEYEALGDADQEEVHAGNFHE